MKSGFAIASVVTPHCPRLPSARSAVVWFRTVHVPMNVQSELLLHVWQGSPVHALANIEAGAIGKSGFDTPSVPFTTTTTQASPAGRLPPVSVFVMVASSRVEPFTGTELTVKSVPLFNV